MCSVYTQFCSNCTFEHILLFPIKCICIVYMYKWFNQLWYSRQNQQIVFGNLFSHIKKAAGFSCIMDCFIFSCYLFLLPIISTLTISPASLSTLCVHNVHVFCYIEHGYEPKTMGPCAGLDYLPQIISLLPAD